MNIGSTIYFLGTTICIGTVGWFFFIFSRLSAEERIKLKELQNKPTLRSYLPVIFIILSIMFNIFYISLVFFLSFFVSLYFVPKENWEGVEISQGLGRYKSFNKQGSVIGSCAYILILVGKYI